MDPKRAGMAMIILFAVLALLFFVVTYFLPGNTPADATNENLTVTHFVSNGMHTYQGSLELETACETLTAAVSVAFSKPPQAKIRLVTDRPQNVPCANIKTEQFFDVAVSSEEMPELSLTLNGAPVAISVIEK